MEKLYLISTSLAKNLIDIGDKINKSEKENIDNLTSLSNILINELRKYSIEYIKLKEKKKFFNLDFIFKLKDTLSINNINSENINENIFEENLIDVLNILKNSININKNNYFFYINYLEYTSNVRLLNLDETIIKKYVFFEYIKNTKIIDFHKLNLILKLNYTNYLNILNKLINKINNKISEDNNLFSLFLKNYFYKNKIIRDKIKIIDNNQDFIVNEIENKNNYYNFNDKELFVNKNKINNILKTIDEDIKYLYTKNELFYLLEKEKNIIEKEIRNFKDKIYINNIKIYNKLNILKNTEKSINIEYLNKIRYGIKIENIYSNNIKNEYINKVSNIDKINNSKISQFENDIDILNKKNVILIKKKNKNGLIMKELEVLLNNLEKDPNYKILKKKKEILKKDYIKRIKNIKSDNMNNLFEFKINKLHTKSLKKNLVIEKNKNELQKRNNIKERTNLLKKIRDIERVKGERNIFIKNIIKHKDYNKGILDEEIGIINKLNNENIKIEKELDNNYKKKQIVIDNIIKNYKDLSNTKINLCKLKELFCKLKELLENKTDYLNELFENYKDKIIEYYDERKKNYYNEIDINIIFKNKIKYENEYIKSFIVNYINFLNELTSNFFSINNFYNIKNYIIYKSVIENEVLDYKNYKKDVKLLRNKCDEYYKLYLNDIDKKIEIGKKNFYKYICINFEEKDKLYRKNLLIKNYKILFKMKEDKLNKVNNYIKKYINN